MAEWNLNSIMTSTDVRTCFSQNRQYLMGIAILWVLVVHLWFFGIYDFGLITFFAQMGGIGVDFFLFLSAFGLSWSIKKYSLRHFYLRRYVRILPTFILLYIIYFSFTGNWEKIFRVSSWINLLRCNWYIEFILLMYTLYPFLYRLQKRIIWLPLFILTCLTIILSAVLHLKGMANIHADYMLVAQRFPIFAIGMLVADERLRYRLRPCFAMLCSIAMFFSLYVLWLKEWEFFYMLVFALLTFPTLLIISIFTPPMQRNLSRTLVKSAWSFI